MSLYPAELPWLHKPAAVAAAGRMIVESALAAQGFPGLPRFRRRRTSLAGCRRTAARTPPLIRERELQRSAYTAPAGQPPAVLPPPRALAHRCSRGLLRVRPLRLSCVSRSAPRGAWPAPRLGSRPGDRPGRAPGSSRSPPCPGSCFRWREPVRLTRREVDERREANERRLAELLETFGSLEIDPVAPLERRAARRSSRPSCTGTSAAGSG